MQVPTNLVGLSHGVPHWHMSQTTSETRALRKKRAIGGHNHILLKAGFSTSAGIRCIRQRKRTLTENLARTLPSITDLLSAIPRFGNPQIALSDRICGGPFGRSRARLQVRHGVPKWTHATAPDDTQPRISCWFRRLSKSNWGPPRMSQAIVWNPLWCMALQSRPEPEKISRKTFTFTIRGTRERACLSRLWGEGAWLRCKTCGHGLESCEALW